MRAALARRDAGAIVRLARRAADITLADLGKQVGYTAASLSRMERGKQPMRDVLLLQSLAACLDIPPHLLGLAPQRRRTASDRPDATRVGTHTLFGEEGDDPVRRRELLATLTGATTSAVLGPPAAAHAPAQPNLSGLEDLLLHRQHGQALAPDPTPSTVAAAVNASRQDFGACRYDTLARALPARIALAQALGDHGSPEQAATAVAELYTVAPACASSSAKTAWPPSPPTGPSPRHSAARTPSPWPKPTAWCPPPGAARDTTPAPPTSPSPPPSS
ncbi:helix-turn-helix domain-containing protein [Streptomyces sp. SRF1]|uniref:helix-turn-helix domain-containing protein n=1 Tax=Streptomyces sp. SRF1 TaxID=1549642 RepID=UPI0025B098E9|nr:helix-turn-helix domain-containing protein [Streptomyces sp. SRF1]MDN3058772.1 helix-turn-helix domain-containing protein [Streptomyces sp. SRF1]